MKQQDIDKQFMQQAYQLAQQAEAAGEIPVGAIVVHAGQIIATGINQSINLHDPTAHAEIIALRQAGKALNNYRLIDCTVYVTLEPCPMCAGAMVHSRIARLVYGAKDEKTGAAGTTMNLVANPQLNHQIAVEGGVMQSECSQQLSQFFQRRRSEIKARRKTAKQLSIES